MREAHGGTEGRVVEGKERQRNSNLDLDVTDFGKIKDAALKKCFANERKVR